MVKILKQEILLKSLNAKYRERLQTEVLRKPTKRELKSQAKYVFLSQQHSLK